MSNSALAGVKVVEFAELVSGPYCAKVMADLGAEVIKIETPPAGDRARKAGPFPNDEPDTEKSGVFLCLNSNKLGISLNLKTGLGLDLFKRLIKECDVFVENHPPQVSAALGISYGELRQVNPALIMTSISPFGQTGPYRNFKANDLISTHMGGLGYLTPALTPAPSQPPLKMAGRQADFYSGIVAAVATMGGLFLREATGQGQHIDISEQECVSSMLVDPIPQYTHQHVIASRVGKPFTAPRGFLQCKDGKIFVLAIEHMWDDMVKVMDNPEWAGEDWCKDNESRSQNWELLNTMIETWTSQYTKQEVFKRLQEGGVPASPLNGFQDLMSSPQLKEREFFSEMQHPVAGSVKCAGAPYKLSQTPWRINQPAPQLGQHNEEVYCKRLGLTRAQLVKLRQMDVI